MAYYNLIVVFSGGFEFSAGYIVCLNVTKLPQGFRIKIIPSNIINKLYALYFVPSIDSWYKYSHGKYDLVWLPIVFRYCPVD